MIRGVVAKDDEFKLEITRDTEEEVLQELHDELPKLLISDDLDYYQQQMYNSFYDPEVPKNKNKHNLQWLSSTFGFEWCVEQIVKKEFIKAFETMTLCELELVPLNHGGSD